MSASSPEITHATQALLDSIGPLLEQSYQRTAAALYEARAATQAELSEAIVRARDANRHGHPADIIDLIVRIQGTEEEQISASIASLSELIAHFVTPYAPRIPFGGKLITPGAFYDAFPTIKTAAKYLLSPVIYAEDTDSIGLASINPIAAQMLGETIITTVHERTGIRPFITLARLDYDAWAFSTRKHFEL